MKFAVEILARGIDYPRFRQVYYSEEFNREVGAALKLTERSLLEFVTEPGGKERRRVHIVPHLHLPAAVQGLMNGQPISYDEVTVFDPATRSATFDIESPAGERVHVTGLARYLEEPGAVRVRFDGDATVKVFGLGGIAERYIIGEVKARYDVVQQQLQKFVDEKRSTSVWPVANKSGK
jgi:hypothetical protein